MRPFSFLGGEHERRLLWAKSLASWQTQDWTSLQKKGQNSQMGSSNLQIWCFKTPCKNDNFESLPLMDGPLFVPPKSPDTSNHTRQISLIMINPVLLNLIKTYFPFEHQQQVRLSLYGFSPPGRVLTTRSEVVIISRRKFVLESYIVRPSTLYFSTRSWHTM